MRKKVIFTIWAITTLFLIVFFGFCIFELVRKGEEPYFTRAFTLAFWILKVFLYLAVSITYMVSARKMLHIRKLSEKKLNKSRNQY